MHLAEFADTTGLGPTVPVGLMRGAR